MAKLEIVVGAKDNASRVLSGIQGKIQNMSKGMRVAGVAMTATGAAIVGGMALTITSFAKAGDEIQKMALRTGFATETLSELKYAAELGGAGLADIEKAVKRMSMSILDAKDGLAETTRSFDKLGISVEDLEGLTPEEQFMLISTALAEVEDASDKAALAQKLFGRAGTALLPMLAGGAEGMEAMRKKAHELGIVFDQEAADKAAEFNDSLTTLKGSFEGVKMLIAETLIPAITNLVDKITPIITKIKDWIEENPQLTKTILIIAAAVGGIMMVLGPLLIILPGIIGILPILGAAFTTLLGPVGLIILGIAALIAIGILVWKNWDKISAFAKTIWGNIVNFFKGVWDKITGIFREHWDKILAILFPAVGIPILIARNWDKIMDFFKDLWVKIKDIFIKIGSAMYAPIATAVDWIISKINDLINIISIIPGIKIGKIGFTMPEFPGTAPSPAVFAPGERFLPGGMQASPATATPINIFLDGELVTERMLERVSDTARLQGMR